MTQRLIHSYPVRFVFVVGALVAAVVIVHYRFLFKGDSRLFQANRNQIGR
jgi:uncharacterized protein involved in response to NO